MSNIRNSSSIIHHFILGTTNSSSTTIWIINERNLTPINIDVYQPSIRIMWYRFLLIIIIFVTAAGNILVCLAIARERKLQNTTNYFLMSLAIADCLVAVLVMPMGMVSEVLGHFPLPHYACIIFATMDVLCCTSSIWHMSTMSMDRYFTIRFPFRYGRNKTRRIMLLKIIAVWAISTAVSSPIFVLGIVDKRNVLSDGICAPNNESFKLYGSVFAFYIPFIIMITTYALTMRSLRNVLVTKKKFSRERRRKQLFQPLAHIVHQYAEIAQNMQYGPSAENPTTISTTTINNNNYGSQLNNASHTLLNSSTSKNDAFTETIQLNSCDFNLKQTSNSARYGSVNISKRISEPVQLDYQHLTIDYQKKIGTKRRRHHQQYSKQTCQINTGIDRMKNDSDMSTLFEIAECPHSRASSPNINNGRNRKSITVDKPTEQLLQMTDSTEHHQIPTTTVITTTSITTATSNNDSSIISPLDEDICSKTCIENKIETDQSTSINVTSSVQSDHSTSLNPIGLISLSIPWQYCVIIIQYIIQYYLFIFPYRTRPLAITSQFNKHEFNEKSFVINKSTSTSSICELATKTSRTVSTQTENLLQLNPSIIPTSQVSITVPSNNSSKKSKFPLNRQILSSTSLFSKCFREPPTTLLNPSVASTKSSTSLSQQSPIGLSSGSYPLQSYGVVRANETDSDYAIADDHRPRASSSSSALMRATYNRRNHTSLRLHRSSKQLLHHQSASSCFLRHSNSHHLGQHPSLTSPTNTNSSDSSTIFQRLNPKHVPSISTPSHQQQQSPIPSQYLRDEHIVAANERKALKVLLIIFCVFVTLWTPFFICTFISAICERCRERISSTVWFSITWLGYSSSMANPFIYTIFSDAFRRAFINIIFCRPSDSLFLRQYSAKLSYQRSAILHQPLSSRRNYNHDYSRASTPISFHHQQSPGGSNATIYINRCTSDSFR